MEMNTESFDMAVHWIFPTFFGLMTFAIGVILVKYVFMAGDDRDKQDKKDE